MRKSPVIYYNILSFDQLPRNGTVVFVNSEMGIVHFGSEVAILDLNWFLNYCDIELVRQASERVRKDNLIAY